MRTLADARAFMLAQPAAIAGRNSWQHAAALLLEASADDLRITAATRALEHALFLEARWLPD